GGSGRLAGDQRHSRSLPLQDLDPDLRRADDRAGPRHGCARRAPAHGCNARSGRRPGGRRDVRLMLAESLDILMFLAVCVLLLAGFPVAFTLAGTALAFATLGLAFGVVDFQFLNAMPQRIFGTMTNEVLVAVPLFVFMGVMLERSKVAEDLLESMGR